MNFDFPLKELPAVMRGPRVERRRVLLGGTAFWGTMVETSADAGSCAWTTAVWSTPTA